MSHSDTVIVDDLNRSKEKGSRSDRRKAKASSSDEEMVWVGNHQYTPFDLEVYAVSKLWNFQKEVKEKVDEKISSLALQGPVCGIHLKRMVSTDIHWPQRILETYFEYMKRHEVECRTIFLVSGNSATVLEEAEESIHTYFPHAVILTLEEVDNPFSNDVLDPQVLELL